MDYGNELIWWMFQQINQVCGGCISEYQAVSEILIQGGAILVIFGIGLVLHMLYERLK